MSPPSGVVQIVGLPEPQEFTCPKCGSHNFSSSCPGLMAVIRQADHLGDNAQKRAMQEHWDAYAVGYCSGDACAFTWRRCDDAEFFRTKLTAERTYTLHEPGKAPS